MTKILFTLGSTGNSDYLNYFPTFELVRGISESGQNVHLLVTDNAEFPETAKQEESGKWLRKVKHDYRTSFGFSHNMAAYLRENDDYDIYHTNGLRTHLNHLTCVTARRKNRPYLITPYGMLRDYMPGNRRGLASKLYHRVFFSHDIRNATCLRAINFEEGKQMRDMGLENPIACIPWPNYIPPYLDEAVAIGQKWKKEHPDNRRVASVITDVDFKSLELLIDAFEAVAEPGSELLLIDFGYVSSTARIKEFLKEHNSANVRIVENNSDFDNTALLASCCSTVIPANHIFMGAVLARSLLCLTPVICVYDPSTENVPAIDCGWWCMQDKMAFERMISASLLMDYDVLDQKGQNGRKQVKETYSTEVVVKQMVRVYHWLLGMESKPDYVI